MAGWNAYGELLRAQLENLSADPTPGTRGRVFWNTALGKPRVDNGTSIQDLGGSNAGGINYVTNPDAEGGTNGWAAYADAAGTSPVDGTGGSPAVTLTQVTSSPLRGLGMFRITKDAVNRQGNGVSYDFTIAAADKAKVLSLSFEYQPSAAFVSGDSADIRVWIYDVTNSRLIQPTPYTIQGGSASTQKFSCRFQSSSDSVSYRLIFHVATTNASAWTFDFDSVVISPQLLVYGAPIGEWETCTVTGSWSSNTTYTAKRRRVGDSEQYRVKVATGGLPTAAALTVTLPTDRTIDTAKLSSTDTLGSLGYLSVSDSDTTAYAGLVLYSSTTAVRTTHFDAAANQIAITQTAPFTFGLGDYVTLEFTVPILGWGTGVVMSNDADTRVVAAKYTAALSSAVPDTATVFNFSTKVYDTHGMVTTGASWSCLVPITGKYRVKVFIPVVVSVADSLTLEIRKNTVVQRTRQNDITTATSQVNNSETDVVIDCVAGDTIDVRFSESVNNAVYAGTQEVSIERISGPASIAASESIAARYTSAAGQSIANAATPIVDFATVDYDTHGAVTTGASWKFTAPAPGKYRITSNIRFANSLAWTQSSYISANLYKSGVAHSTVDKAIETTASFTQGVSVHYTGSVSLLAGEYIDLRVAHGESAARALVAAGTLVWICIEKIGNY